MLAEKVQAGEGSLVSPACFWCFVLGGDLFFWCFVLGGDVRGACNDAKLGGWEEALRRLGGGWLSACPGWAGRWTGRKGQWIMIGGGHGELQLRLSAHPVESSRWMREQ